MGCGQPQLTGEAAVGAWFEGVFKQFGFVGVRFRK
jgi:hypothetical protein